MMGFIEELASTYSYYFDNGIFALLLMIGAALVLIYGEYTRKIILVFLPVFVIAITILNPVYWKIAKVAAEYAYVRSYWNVPFYFLLACMIVSLISKMKRRKKRIIVVLALMVIIIGWGTSIAGISTGSDKFSKTQNIYKLPSVVVDIANCVQQDAGEEETLLYAPEEICMYIRECDANIGLLYHPWWKEMYTGFGAYEMIIDGEKIGVNYEDMSAAINTDTPEYDYIIKMQDVFHWNYLVLKGNPENSEAMLQEHDVILIKKMDGYSIYKYVEG